jgi:hypothetical protein
VAGKAWERLKLNKHSSYVFRQLGLVRTTKLIVTRLIMEMLVLKAMAVVKASHLGVKKAVAALKLQPTLI